jgi:hypothetical protein
MKGRKRLRPDEVLVAHSAVLTNGFISAEPLGSDEDTVPELQSPDYPRNHRCGPNPSNLLAPEHQIQDRAQRDDVGEPVDDVAAA